jgi:methyl-accepting chemotaxis protein
VVCGASLYVVFATLFFCVFYTYILGPLLNPAQAGTPSLLSFPEDFRNQWRASAELRGALHVWIAGTLGMTAMFALATGLELSRKLAGPIHRLKCDLKRMEAGEEVFEITLRDNDELRDVAAILNQTLRAIEDRHVQRCSGTSDNLAADERMAGLSALRAHLDALSTGPDSSGALTEWATRMRDLIDKAESASES